MRNEYDIEQTNRNNFRSSLEALARPGELQPVVPLFGSGLLAMASVLLYAEVSFYYQGKLDFELIRAVCGARGTSRRKPTIFFSIPWTRHIWPRPRPEQQKARNKVLLFSLPVLTSEMPPPERDSQGRESTVQKKSICRSWHHFIDQLLEKNESFPMGIDVFFISQDNTLLGLPRTTRIEVIA